MNNFSNAAVPTMIASLVHLEYLNLSYARFDGPIPPQFQNFSNLHYLDLHGWYDDFLHVDDLDWLSHIPSLKYLDMSFVNLSKATNWIYVINSIPSLEVLHLGDNSISGKIPPIVGDSVRLEYLDLSNNGIIGKIPQAIGNLSNLLELHLSSNKIVGWIPPSIGNLSNLLELHLSSNKIVGWIPPSIGNLTNLAIGNLSNLLELHLSSNKIVGWIPPSIGNLTNLGGKFPDWIQTQQQLQSLYLSGVMVSGENKLFGKIPKWIGRNVSSLKVLRLRSNLLYGVIPENIVNLTSLQVLDLSSNNLSGSLPSSLGNFTAMVEVQNKTWSSIEGYYFYFEERLVITKVFTVEEYYYYIESILLTTKGEIADYTTILSLMTFIDLSNNHLSGEIPKELTKLLGLRFLNLSNNHLTGRIPEKMGDMKLLESLDLSVNSLTREIPSSFSSMHFLESMNLSYNNLSGKIPTSSQLSTFDSWTYVGNKDLCGTPLPDCPVYQTPPDARVKQEKEGEDDEKQQKLLEYSSIVVGFWLFIGTLIVKQAIRVAFF
ncbi:hypothetical protein C4D60_Mb01t03440 [Musa balbisiana]|uniref:Disease resistance R13L4/SHOC-2-like LRR domain-containing protein n=1 Tax=Musa balbisiana TaxID=52838 RepID=A0A4S8JJK2_MUSBA|nr:hypothetical protein C4D60_Mb01t03440 [Musa balbisiana]